MQRIDWPFLLGLLSAIAGWVASFFTPIFPYLAAAAVLTITDTVTGVRAAVKRGETIDMHKFFRLFEKVALYAAAIVCAETIEVVFVKGYIEYVPLTYSVALAISFREFRSNISNIEQATGASIWEQIRRFAGRIASGQDKK